MRRSSSSRYDILTSAEAWSTIGTLGTEEFTAVRAEMEKLAWSAFSMPGAASTRLNVIAGSVGVMFEIDHASRRVTVLSLSRGADARNRLTEASATTASKRSKSGEHRINEDDEASP